MKKILFTTVCRPFGGPGEGHSVGAELFHFQITRAQGLFSLRQVFRVWALDYLAENIRTPSVVLHYPSEKELIAELKSGDFEYVGVNFVVPIYHKARRVAALVRQHAPNAKIVFGGYGTCLPDELLTPFCDHVCKEEGVGFMRRLLGEPTDRPIEHPYAPIPSARIYSYHNFEKTVGLIAGGLGCAAGCDFCSTSHFFQRKHIAYLKTGREVYDALSALEKKAADRGRELTNLIFIDEDFFAQKKRAREFLEVVRKEGKIRFMTGFGSVKSLSNFTAEEIAEMGFDSMWIGIEGVKADYPKMRGKSYEELFAELKAHGILIVGSSIIGYPYQDRAQVLEEFERLVRLAPTMTQFMQYTALPGTELHRQAVLERRFTPEAEIDPDLRRWDGFGNQFKLPGFERGELDKLIHEVFRKEFERLGPTVMRLSRVWFEGYKTHKESPNPLLRYIAERKKADVLDTIPGLWPCMYLGPSPYARSEAKKLYRELNAEFGPDWKVPIKGAICLGLACFSWAILKLEIFQQPGLLRVQYPLDPAGKGEVPIRRLYGGFHANPLKSIWEDVTWALGRLKRRMFPSVQLKGIPPLPRNTMNLPKEGSAQPERAVEEAPAARAV